MESKSEARLVFQDAALPGQAFLVHQSEQQMLWQGYANPKRHASKQRQNPPNVYSYLTGPELESAIRGCTAVAAAYTSVPPARIVQSWQFEQ